MNLFLRLQKDLGVACLFIAHDLELVRQAASRVYVMYLGKVIEGGSSLDVYARPGHPYTSALLASVPSADPRIEALREAPVLKGDIPSPTNPPSGCRFRTRCPQAMEICAVNEPETVALSSGHSAACVIAEQVHRGEVIAPKVH